MKVLFYNWIQFDNKDNIGGGVNIYQKNLINYFVKNTNDEIYFISSGWKYNPFKRKTYIEQSSNIYTDSCKSFEIINSPIMAPTFTMFMNQQKFITDEVCYECFDKFLEQYGPFDVIHFNNIEGISINVLKLKEKYPSTKFIVSIHNYQTICSQVNYFNEVKGCTCKDYKNGEECLNCIKYLPSKKEYYRRCKVFLKEKYRNKKILFSISKVVSKVIACRNQAIIGSRKNMQAQTYKQYREMCIEYLNKYCDQILAVSKRVEEIMIDKGIEKSKITTSYIGTIFAEHEIRYSIANSTEPFTIAYLGYKRVDKGFFFFIKSLENMNPQIAKKINIVLAVSDIYPKEIEKLNKFNKVIVHNGYTHKTMPKILSDVNLGIVPVLWEDNLPQVAIEMVACGVPILCSNLGGASELSSSERFKFKGGDESQFLSKLTDLVNNPTLLKDYWENHNGLTTMKTHIKELLEIYKI